MQDVHYDFMICGVPDDETTARITEAIRKVLMDEFNTEIYIYPTVESD